MNTERFLQNITDQIKEAQLKLGYAKETVRLYYPTASLNGLLGTDFRTAKELAAALRDAFSEETRLGKLQFRTHADRIEVGIGPEGAEYVHSQVAAPAFLKDLIELFQTHHSCSLEELQEVFGRHGSYVCEKMPEGSDFDYVMYFEDDAVDEYYYCIKMEMGHTIYHRFVKDDYLALISSEDEGSPAR